MADRIADDADLAVDELRRKARRRLVGAIVLALAAAILLPLLLEKEPKPLGDDVAVQIPPVDEGRFVNRLTGQTSKEPAKAAAKEPKAEPSKGVEPEPSKAAGKSDGEPLPAVAAPAAPAATPVQPIGAAPAPSKALADAEQRVLTPSAKGTPKPTAAAPKAAAPAAPKAEAKADAAAPPVPAPAAAPPAAAKAEPGAEPKPDAGSAPAREGFVVQLAAFTDDKGANALAARLKKAGYAAYTEPVQTSRGTLYRVRVGGYATRDAAVAARDRLKAEGQSGIVAPAK
jgi:DedD protein